jgi:RNA polymerase sigma-70 factor (ECF subfamily)
VSTPTKEPTAAAEYATFMRAYQDMVYSTAVRLTGSEAHAEDIAQEVFLRAFEHFAQLRDSAGAGGWLKTVATRLSFNHLKRYRKRWSFFSELRRADDEEPPEVEFPSSEDVLAELDAHERAALVERALRELPEHQRVPLVLYHFEAMPYAAIARELSISLAKVKSDIFRGRAALASRLAQDRPQGATPVGGRAG